MLEDDTLLLRLILGKGREEIVALQRFTHEDLPEKAKTLGTIAEVHEYFQDAQNFQIDP